MRITDQLCYRRKRPCACIFFEFLQFSETELCTLKVTTCKQGKCFSHLLVCCIVIEVLIKFKEKGRRIISAYLAKIKQIYQNKLNYWHNFRNIRVLQVAYYATFSSTVSKPRGKEIPRRGEGGRQFKNEAISEEVGVAFRGVFPEALCKIGELLKSNSCSVEQAVSYFRRSFIYGRLNVF